MRSSRRRGLVMSGVLTMTILGMAVAPVGAATASYCGITWGSTAKSGSLGSVGYVTAVRAGRHHCFDRLVFEGTAAFNVVQYVSQVTTDPKGDPVPLAGGAFLQVQPSRPDPDAALTSWPPPGAPGDTASTVVVRLAATSSTWARTRPRSSLVRPASRHSLGSQH